MFHVTFFLYKNACLSDTELDLAVETVSFAPDITRIWGLHNSHWFSLGSYCVGRWKLDDDAWIYEFPVHGGTAIYKYVRGPPGGNVGLAKPRWSQAKTDFFLVHRAFACVSSRFFSVPNWDHKIFGEKKTPQSDSNTTRLGMIAVTYRGRIAWWKLRCNVWLNIHLLVTLVVQSCHYNNSASAGVTTVWKMMSDGRMEGEAKAYGCVKIFFFFWSISCLNKIRYFRNDSWLNSNQKLGSRKVKTHVFIWCLQYASAWSLLSTNNVLASILISSLIIPEEYSWCHVNWAGW